MGFSIKPGLIRSLLCVIAFISSSVLAVPQYELTDIDVLLGVNSTHTKIASYATTINDKGHVAGYYMVTVDGRGLDKEIAFIYRPDVGVEELVGPRDRGIRILDLNSKDQFIGKWISNTGDESYFINRHGWEDLESPLKSVTAINDNGDILGLAEGKRGTIKSSVAIWTEDYTLVDIMEGLDDCDPAISGDCSADNRIDFESWTDVMALDLNNKGQVLFTLKKPAPGGFKSSAMVYTPGQGYKKIKSDGTIASGAINNNGMISLSYTVRRSHKTFIYSSDGTDLTPTTIFEFSSSNDTWSWRVKTLNDANVSAGDKLALSLTDATQIIDLGIEINDLNNSNVVVGTKGKKATVYSPVDEDQILIDGNFDDWGGRSVFSDAVDDGGVVNWDQVWADDGDGHLSFSFSNIGDIDASQLYLWNIYLDTDKQAATGYNFKLLGADYLIQGKSLYQYAGTGLDWSWNYLKEVDYADSGARAELAILKSALGLPADATSSYRALFYGADPNGGNLDYLLIDVNGRGGNVVMEEISAPEGGQ
jgi:hypothetical protein